MLRSLKHYWWAQSQEHHTIDSLEKRGAKRKRQTISSGRMREGHHQSDQHWNCFKGDVGEEMGWSAYGFSERIDTTLKWTELNWTPQRDSKISCINLSLHMDSPWHNLSVYHFQHTLTLSIYHFQHTLTQSVNLSLSTHLDTICQFITFKTFKHFKLSPFTQLCAGQCKRLHLEHFFWKHSFVVSKCFDLHMVKTRFICM